MGAVDDYINGLEGRENLDPLAIARDLHELHRQEVTTREATIEVLNSDIAERDTKIAERDTEITRWKAKNFDLAQQIPGFEPKSDRKDDDTPTGSEIKASDLFNENVRRRHALG